MTKLIFISNNWGDAHQQTRLNALKQMPIPIECLAFSRPGYPCESNYKPLWISTMEDSDYHKRYKAYVSLLFQLLKSVAPGDICYVYGFDLLLVTVTHRALSGTKMKIIYEVPDLRELFFSKTLKGRILRWIERQIIPLTNLLVVTSENYVSDYFVRWRKIAIPEYLVIENKIHPRQISGKPLPAASGSSRTRIGYFGVLRCSTSLECLIALANTGRFEVILAGIFMPSTEWFKKKVSSYNGISYRGPFRSPSDSGLLYSLIDVIWAVYPYSFRMIGNHRWARTNRFYESLFYNKPAIVQKGSADAQRAAELGGIAIEVDMKNQKETVEYLTHLLSSTYITAKAAMMETIAEKNYLITDEYNPLYTWIMKDC